MKKIKWLFSMMCLLILTACSKADDVDDEKKEEMVSNRATTIAVEATQLQVPWSIQKANETFYISERNGTIAVVQNGQVTREPVQLNQPLSSQSEAGLLGFLLMPDFAKSQRAIAYYTYEQDGESLNRVVILQRSENKWHEITKLLDGIVSGQYHHGGRLQIGKDGLLYITTGDGLKEERAQNLQSLSGKILRMNLDGSVPEDNPFSNSYVYSYGHRNPQGLTWDEQGNLYSSEHGSSAHDELNTIVAGANYGWPIIQGDEKKEGMVTPIIHSGNVTWAPAGLAYHNGNLYVATLRGEALKRYHLQSKVMEDVVKDVGRIRDVFIEGNMLYFISNNTDGRGNPSKDDDQLYKVEL
ncbi:PQQ-dependent sugar dehydrogenase [Bacillus massiliigorillae]|uniref:PQQ-dependent sugar dehydrogenase n=1 Tax=Bacillus massiliigorillae TaxID=1243664 RepID=UPI00039F1ACF|nr:PQQ-dependent sugar dehydrogenase [Bacillus massiliigorillae]